ncbi:lysophospholipid acyltransferase family protein [Thermodesulfovibrio yellowstonii]|uniref:1-acyl-sn-glycerol-3-phosphate acyltransferase, putative n=2 Tax=Thermodesulfovibrio yellowstonii TaxID=28262 RepID=B5YI02_THEYD|nr:MULTISPECIES: lysophospholipid acyltransferase family protein [Thermodesulfovibrio]ACI21484.1 1-acyl-sn-glycerol-3-phosphate acyltransferase, putative [Thermodesulfovibrio yellowstonii DSM 11347]GLI54405.1 1-acyl-sn-glycerol-3-phosphate acyltransferase [Thermodesulfovibrio islandicus]
MITLRLHTNVIKKIILSAFKANRGKYTYEELVIDGLKILDMMRDVGCKVTIEGKENLKDLKPPCVFIANHMSTLETLVLPAVIGKEFKVTFVVKKSLLKYPFFGKILAALKPIPVTRKNPKEDYRIVIQDGFKRLQEGISVIVFPQATREIVFEPSRFNTLGIKLAKKANVPAVPIALRTDAWGVGKIIKDFGKIDPTKPICFFIGKPLYIENKGIKEHLQIIEFIEHSLRKCYN